MHIGIDVSKDHLDVAVHETGEGWICANAGPAFSQLIARLARLSPTLIVLEASGGYEQDVLWTLISAGLPVALVNPRQTHNFAKATGRFAKTDRIDAKMLAHFAKAVHPALARAPASAQLALAELVQRRKALLEMLTAEKNRLRLTKTPAARELIERHIAWLARELDDIDRQLSTLVHSSETWRALERVIGSVPGVGRVAIALLIARLPELGQLNRREVAALVGVAPFNQDSGRHRGARRIAGGREDIRTLLYMCAIAGLRCNPMLKAFYQRLKDQGKPTKVALTACIRKLLVTLNAMVRDGKTWEERHNATVG